MKSQIGCRRDKMDDLKKTRDTFAKIVEIMDNLIALEERQNNGEDVSEEYEVEAGKLIVQMVKLEGMK